MKRKKKHFGQMVGIVFPEGDVTNLDVKMLINDAALAVYSTTFIYYSC